MLQVNHLAYERNDVILFEDLNFELNPCEFLQISGANGAGKTSLLRILCGLVMPTHGQVKWQGALIQDNRDTYHAEMIYLGHQNGLKSGLTVSENLQLLTELGNKPSPLAAAQVLESVNLTTKVNTLVGQLSMGQQRRVALTRLLLCKAKLWILDEPFAALDAQGKDFIEKILAEHLLEGGSVVMTTHQPMNLNQFAMQVKDITLGISP